MISWQHCLLVPVAGVAVVLARPASAQLTPTVGDPSGHLIRTQEGSDSAIDVPPGAASIALPCAMPGLPGVVYRESRTPSRIVDACGRQSAPPGRHWLSESVIGSGPTGAEARVVIDSMSLRSSSSGFGVVSPVIALLGSADTYYLSNGTSWSSGAGSYSGGSATLDRVETSGDLIRYYFNAPSNGVLYQQTDYDAGDHSAQGTLGASGPLLLEATRGSSLAIMRGRATIISNDATWYGEPRFNYYAAPVGSLVPFELRFTLTSPGGWTESTFNGPGSYIRSGSVSFVEGVSLPPLAEVTISGPPQLVGTATFEYRAIARYENSALREVTSNALWSVEPVSLASIDQGLLTTLPLQTPQETLTIRVTYTEGDITRTAEKQVLYREFLTGPVAESWPMYQANERHTGYQPMTLDPTQFTPLWQTRVGQQNFPLNPVTAAKGRVFCSLSIEVGPSLFALEAETGTELWSKTFSGGPFSVNPPSYGYGNVYIQTCDHSYDTWLHAFDAETGAFVFRSPHAAQWERYYAPTIFDGKVYINGGSYGGAYGFDALTGAQEWFAGLPQYDKWTPAIDGDFVYSYVGEYQPGLYILERATGTLVDRIPDPNFGWNGWSMNLAPVVGAHDDVIAIHDGRLISFDTELRTIRWELAGGFSGQPTVAHDSIFAIQNGRLAVLDEVTHASQWSWQPPQGQLTGTLIATDTHVFGATSQAVHAIDLESHQSVWSYPASGHLALGNGALYVAGSTGQLTAIRVAPSNRAPDCSAAVATVDRLWPPSRRLERVSISGVTDADGDPVTITVTGITQDEPSTSFGDDTCPDGVIDAEGTAWIRLERQVSVKSSASDSGRTNGRVYEISFTATDPSGAVSNGRVTLCVPSHGSQGSCFDDGQAFDSLDCDG